MIAVDHRKSSIWHVPPQYHSDQLALTNWPLLSEILLNRGVSTRSEAEAYLCPDRVALADPHLLPDMEQALKLIQTALASDAGIGIFGDYDVDGLSSTAMLTRALTSLGAQPLPIIPHRKRDGYGLNVGAIEQFLKAGVQLLITVDCGSGNLREIEFARSKGLKVIVLDHHQTHANLPSDVPFVSPRRSSNLYPETELAGAGVAYTLVRALLGEAGAEMYMPYAALGTIADVVSLRNENRHLAARGLDMLRRWSLPGFIAMCDIAGINKRKLSSRSVGFIIGPRLNAAGRMDTPDIALNWFLANTMAEAEPFANQLDMLNRTRQAETRRVMDEAETQIATFGNVEDLPAIVVASDAWSIGVAGIVAGRLAEKYYRPAIVIEARETMSKGSARSAGTLDIVDALRHCEHLLDRYGGHSAAAGLSLPANNVAAFRDALSSHALEVFGGRIPTREYHLDAVVNHRDLTLDTVDRLEILEPTGHGNEPPLFLIRNLRPSSVRTSRNGKHLLFQVIDEHECRHQAVFFGAGEREPELSAQAKIDVAGSIQRNSYKGRVNMQIVLEDFRSG